jgi:hypothetical protein
LETVAVPRLKGITVAVDPLRPAGWTMTWVAVMVVLSVVPSTRTSSPFVTALAEAVLVPFSYAVPDASWTVTCWPADVVRVKPDVVTLLTVPPSAVAIRLGQPGRLPRDCGVQADNNLYGRQESPP